MGSPSGPDAPRLPVPEASVPNPMSSTDPTDFWIETKDDATGKPYYYHSTTLQTSWKRPPGLIVLESELEILTDDVEVTTAPAEVVASPVGVGTAASASAGASQAVVSPSVASNPALVRKQTTPHLHGL